MEFCERAYGPVISPALELTGVRKRFDSVVALDGADFVLRAGTVHALLGENGAGKTTLMRVAFGLVAADAGTVAVRGITLTLASPADAMRAGLGMVQQHFTLVPALTSLENVALGWSSSRAIRDRAIGLAAETGIRFDPDAPVDRLSVADQQRVELLKALARGARTLILDEPTAALAPGEAEELFSWVRSFREGGGSVVLITHKLGEALAIADDITVLREGAVTWSGGRSEASVEALVTALIGEASHALTVQGNPVRRLASEEVVVAAEGLDVNDRGVPVLRGVSVQLRQREIVGVAGVDGSGVQEFMHAMAGRLAPASGRLRIPTDVAFVPEDRHRDALLMTASVAENVALKSAGTRGGWLRTRTIEATADRIVAANDVRLSDVRAPVSTLSGGNQQRLVLARELEGDPPLIVAINPTRGLDIAATRQVQTRLRNAADRGAAVLYYSADLDELLEMSDRVLVVYDGRVNDVPRDREAIGRAMVGVS